MRIDVMPPADAASAVSSRGSNANEAPPRLPVHPDAAAKLSCTRPPAPSRKRTAAPLLVGRLVILASREPLNTSASSPSPRRCALSLGEVSGAIPVEPWQTPAEHCPLPEQASWSSHGPVLFGCVHEPEPLQTSFVQSLVSPVQTAPADSNWQSLRQQSPLLRLPSSQASPDSRTPLPQAREPAEPMHDAELRTGAMLCWLQAEKASASEV